MKTIYLLHTKLGAKEQSAIAFDCEECAKVLFSYYRKSKLPVILIPVQLFSDMRDAARNECEHMTRGFATDHQHAPQVIG